ncbi:EGF-like domain-containing protein [Tieghemostelium lacteum]|uniref:EGF-like domain-containing protein n=1 Tax=Tieghemostelium lacteum TaxID=361077 RepID=A0A152A6A7_TIELA|nr:EGF-like domain-containing protein [Tieghemostelium lacteum]|eukprot:KYR01645.1 EGF-like domain-containing protein [Tieghemostelium lacteum]
MKLYIYLIICFLILNFSNVQCQFIAFKNFTFGNFGEGRPITTTSYYAADFGFVYANSDKTYGFFSWQLLLDFWNSNETNAQLEYESGNGPFTLSVAPIETTLFHNPEDQRSFGFYSPTTQYYQSYGNGLQTKTLTYGTILQPAKVYYYFRGSNGENGIYTLVSTGSGNIWFVARPGLPGGTSVQVGAGNSVAGNYNYNGYAWETNRDVGSYYYANDGTTLMLFKFYSSPYDGATQNISTYQSQGLGDAAHSSVFMCTTHTDSKYYIDVFQSGGVLGYIRAIPMPTGVTSCGKIEMDYTQGQIFVPVIFNGILSVFSVAYDGTSPRMNKLDGSSDNPIVGLKVVSAGLLLITRAQSSHLVTYHSTCPNDCSGNGLCVYKSCQCALPAEGINCGTIQQLNVTKVNVDYSSGFIKIEGTELDKYSENVSITYNGQTVETTINFVNGTYLTFTFGPSAQNGQYSINIGQQSFVSNIRFQPKITNIDALNADSKTIKFQGDYLGNNDYVYFKNPGDEKIPLTNCKEQFANNHWEVECDFDPSNLDGTFYIQSISSPTLSSQLSSTYTPPDVDIASSLVSSLSLTILLLSFILLM